MPAIAIPLVVPPAAYELLFRPFELARFDDVTHFRKAGVRFVYVLEESPAADRIPSPNLLDVGEGLVTTPRD